MLNQCTFLGRLTKDPELQRTRSGKAVTSFTIAVDRDRPDQNGDWIADFIDFVAWEKVAEKICAKYKKGDLISATGRLQNRSVKAFDGQPRVISEVVVQNCQKVTVNRNPSSPASTPASEVVSEDDYDAPDLDDA